MNRIQFIVTAMIFVTIVSGIAVERITYSQTASHAAVPPLTASKFTELFASIVKREIPTAEVKVEGDLAVHVKTPKGEVRTFLDNAWKQYGIHPEQANTILRTYVTTTQDSLAKSEIPNGKMDLATVLPVVRNTGFAKNMKQQFGDKWDGVTESFANNLDILYVESLPNTMRFVTRDDLKELHIQASYLRAVAIKNLRVLLPKATWNKTQAGLLLHVDGNFESSFLMLDEFWQTKAPPVDGDIVMIVPARDMVIVTGSKSADAVQTLRELATRGFAAFEHPVSDSLYVRKGNTWAKE